MLKNFLAHVTLSMRVKAENKNQAMEKARIDIAGLPIRACFSVTDVIEENEIIKDQKYSDLFQNIKLYVIYDSLEKKILPSKQKNIFFDELMKARLSLKYQKRMSGLDNQEKRFKILEVDLSNIYKKIVWEEE